MNLPLNTDLTGKVAVVTGAAGALCSVFSKALAASGAKVALLGRTYTNLRKLAEEITAEGGTAKAYECSVLDKAAVFACHEQVLRDLGPCDILLNGAGGNHPVPRPTRNTMSRAIWTPTPRASLIWTRRASNPFLTSILWGF